MELELRLVEVEGAHEAGARPGGRPTLVDRVWPPGLHLLQGFFIISKKLFREVSGHSKNFFFAKK